MPPLAVPSSLVSTIAGDVDGRGELLGLAHAVLAGGRVDREQRLVRRAGQLALEHAAHLLELGHQVGLGVQAPGGVEQHDARAGLLGLLDRVPGDRARDRRCPSCARSATPERSAQISSCSAAAARKVSPAAITTSWPWARRREAILPIVVVLPVPLTPTIISTVGLRAEVDAAGLRSVRISSAATRRSARREVGGGDERAGGGLGLEPLDDGDGARDADVRGDQALLDPLPCRVVGRIECSGRDLGGHRASAAREAVAEAREPPAAATGLVAPVRGARPSRLCRRRRRVR